MVTINPSLCHHEYKFAKVIQKVGVMHPHEYIILYCKKCCDLKYKEIKIK